MMTDSAKHAISIAREQTPWQQLSAPTLVPESPRVSRSRKTSFSNSSCWCFAALSFACSALCECSERLSGGESAEGAERKFARAPNLLDLGDEKVTARQIVNVLGRWTTHTQWWEGIGVSVNLEAILNDPSKMAELKPMSEAVRTKSGNLRRALALDSTLGFQLSRAVANPPFEARSIASSAGVSWIQKKLFPSGVTFTVVTLSP
mgnify:CR=1 FL=1